MITDFLQKNLENFSKRFPQLCEALLTVDFDGKPPTGFEVLEAKNKELTAKFENNYLHSAYNPGNEAKKFVTSAEIQNSDTIVFLGIGLAHSLLECSKSYKNKTIVVIEPDPIHILVSFSCVDWGDFFSHSSLVFLPEAPQQTIIAILERYGLNECYFVAQKAIMQHAENYFTDLQLLIERNKAKQSINMRTLEKFSTLWLSNMCKNFQNIENLDGIEQYKNKAGKLNACVLAAGPSLDAILPHLEEIKKRCILICVDTALRACLKAGVEPHFIILVDPQYWNARHIMNLESPSSILITESAAYPTVFRFNCKETILCSSLFPLGKYIENFTGQKGTLSAGGSVATSAWDFARFIGCQNIFMAGLDLSFPNKKTHAKGSTFEEKIHSESNKFSNFETAIGKQLYNEHTEIAKDYANNDVITDARMKLYAWWFESKCITYIETKTYSLSSESLAIPGINPSSVEALMQIEECENQIEDFVNIKSCNTTKLEKNTITNALLEDFSDLQDIVYRGSKLCKKTINTENDCNKILKQLEVIDSEIKNSKAKNIVSLVFPTPEQLDEIMKKELPNKPLNENYITMAQYSIQKSCILYDLIKKSIDKHIYYLQKNM